MNIYVSANQKGGVGKTTVALGIGCALARRGSRVLLIDCDPQASATKVLRVTCDGRCTVADVLPEPGRYRRSWRSPSESSWPVAAERRAGLSTRRSPRPHRASPDALDGGADKTTPGVAAEPTGGEEELEMLCVRVNPVLRRDLKLLAARSGRSIQEIVADCAGGRSTRERPWVPRDAVRRDVRPRLTFGRAVAAQS